MNANELAYKCGLIIEDYDFGIQVATMLRQQAKEIAMLKQIIDANNLQSDIGQLKKELALQRLSDIGQEIENEPSVQKSEMPTLGELNDEEIESAYWSLVGKQHEGKIASYLYNFARAILKQASEK